MKVHVEAYGCALNRGEAAEFIDALIGHGHTVAENPEGADACAIFTCGVIETTERRMLRRIRALANACSGPLLVGGCLPAICPERISAAAPKATQVGPARHLEGVEFIEGGATPSNPSTPNPVGILPIATGCVGECSYCITRKARGGLRSRPVTEIAGRLDELISHGAVEVQLCSQDTACYGQDIGADLQALVSGLASRDGDFMLRIGMMNPSTVMARLESIIIAYQSPRVFKFLHLPVQSGSDSVLERMNRRHTADDFLRVVDRFRKEFPGMALSTDIIIGFPGETDEDFRMSMALMHEAMPDIINVTRFSARPGTPAHAMKNKVPGWRAKEWSRQMTELRFRLTSENYARMKGETVRALATERRKPGTAFMRTANYNPVVVRGELALGSWHEVKITGNARTHLLGKLSE